MRFRVRTLLIAVALVAISLWTARLGMRSRSYSQQATNYAVQERYWRLYADRGNLPRDFRIRSADYMARQANKYRRASWRPWESVAPDPPAPGHEAYQEQQRREAARSGAADTPPHR